MPSSASMKTCSPEIMRMKHAPDSILSCPSVAEVVLRCARNKNRGGALWNVVSFSPTPPFYRLRKKPPASAFSGRNQRSSTAYVSQLVAMHASTALLAWAAMLCSLRLEVSQAFVPSLIGGDPLRYNINSHPQPAQLKPQQRLKRPRPRPLAASAAEEGRWEVREVSREHRLVLLNAEHQGIVRLAM